jgi:NADH-quinone oxidoreductase subunit M
MNSMPLLSLVTFLPLVGAAFILILRGETEAVARNARWIALWTTALVFLVSVRLWIGFDPHASGFQFVEQDAWIPSYHLTYHMGIDGFSLFFVLLAALLTPLCIIFTWESIRTRVKEYMVALLILETMMVGSFCALDFVIFYFFFEGVLIPMFVLVGVWGGPARIKAAFKFFLYSLLGSVLMLLGILVLYHQLGTTDIPTAMTASLPREMQIWLFLAFFIAFAIKMPMWPFHTWLLDATVEAPTAATVLMAAVMHKMGAYGFLRFMIPVFPDASAYFMPLVFTLSVVAVLYTSLVALVQEDMKRLIAYSSIAHMGFVTIGIFTLTQQGVQGAVMQMISHGVVVGALFLCAGSLIDRADTRQIARYGGVAHVMPKFALVFMIFTMASLGLPGTSGFIGEFLVLIGAFEANSGVAVLTTLSVILVAAYMLIFYRRIVFGTVTRDAVQAMADLGWREKLVFAPLLVLVFWIGLYPGSFLDPVKPASAALIARGELAVQPRDHLIGRIDEDRPALTLAALSPMVKP